jgi:hypothetical protein
MPINCISRPGYVDECDHIRWDKHYEDNYSEDQTFTVMSLGDAEFDTAPGSLYEPIACSYCPLWTQRAHYSPATFCAPIRSLNAKTLSVH